MKERQDLRDSQIGLLAYGSVHTQNLVLHVGGQARPLYELDTEVLEAKRTTLEAAIRHRLRMNMIPRGLTVAVTLYIWSTIPSALQSFKGNDVSAAMMAVLMLAIGAVTAWKLVQLQMGRWQRRNALTIQQLESALAQLDAELDMRSPAHEFTVWAQLRKMMNRSHF